jgi:hypothetical protein
MSIENAQARDYEKDKTDEDQTDARRLKLHHTEICAPKPGWV